MTPQWRTLSPSGELLVEPTCSARCVIRDTRAPDQAASIGPLRSWGSLSQSRRGAPENSQRHDRSPGAALSAYAADRRELSDRDGGGGNSAVAKTGPNIPNTVKVAAAELRKAARGSPAGDS
jgi:hypothetical protein